MAMTVKELFYGGSDPGYFSYYGRHSQTLFPSYSQAQEFDLMVPMRCTNCEGEVRSALRVMGSVTGVEIDRSTQRVGVAGCNTDPAHALRQVRQVKKGATRWNNWGSSSSSSRHSDLVSTSSHQKSRLMQQSSNKSYVEGGRSSAQQSDHGSYARTFCPSYGEATVTHFVSVNPTIATRVEMDW